jgi:Rieske Fe-S protein
MADDEEPDPRHDLVIPEGDPGRRRFLKIATCAIGGGIGAVVAVPAVRYLLDPVGRKVVTTGTEPIDVASITDLEIGGAPKRYRVIAPSIRDGWSTIDDVPLGAAWLSRPSENQVVALSSICPHLGCAVGFDGNDFRCPCHESAFAPSGERKSGPAERGLDPLPVAPIGKDGRIRLTWIQYRQGGKNRVPT